MKVGLQIPCWRRQMTSVLSVCSSSPLKLVYLVINFSSLTLRSIQISQQAPRYEWPQYLGLSARMFGESVLDWSMHALKGLQGEWPAAWDFGCWCQCRSGSTLRKDKVRVWSLCKKTPKSLNLFTKGPYIWCYTPTHLQKSRTCLSSLTSLHPH